jgi:hypothetical protein
MTTFIIIIAACIGVVAAFVINVALANHKRAREDTAHARRLSGSQMYINNEE